MVIPALKNKANMASHNGGRDSSGLNINQDYPLIDWSTVPAPNMTPAPIMPAANSTRQINWEANCQFQERPSPYNESADNRNNTMLQHCNDFFSSWRAMAPPSNVSDVTSNTQERFQNVSPVDQQEFNIIRPVTPPTPISVTEIFSPNTVNEVRSTIRALYPNGPPPAPPVIPVKRHKKGDTPYIVGCTKRPRVPEKKTLNVFKGDDYGITKDTNGFNDEDCPAKRKRGKRNQYPNWSKSRFNPKSDEIAATLKMNEKVDKMLHKPAGNDKAAYMATPYTSRPQAFNPLPSTSKDNETIMKNEKQFSESLKYENFNVCDDDDDDDDLPDVQWESENSSENQRQSLFQSRNIELICNEESSVKSEDLNNNNSIDEVDLREIQFDNYMPKKEFPVPIVTTTTTNDPIVIDEIDLDNFIEAGKPKQKVTETLEIKDDYNSITYEDLYSVPNTSDIIDVDDLLKDLRHFQHNKKPVNQDIITIVDPADLETSRHQKPCVHINENVPVNSIANHGTTATEEAGIIEIPESEPISRLNYQPSTSEIEFVSETMAGDRNNSSHNHSTGDDSDKDTDASIADSVYNAVFRELNGCCSVCVMPDVCDELASIHRALTKYGEYLKSTSQPRSRRKKKQKISSPQEQPQQAGAVNNENAAPSTNGQTSSPTNGERRLGDCPICMDNLARGAIASTTCGHVFCLSCIKKCLRTSGKKCPTCRKTLKGPGYHQVFL